MKWMLIVAVFGGQPVKTELLFDDLKSCLAAEEAMRKEMSEAYGSWDAWAGEIQGLARYGGDSRQTSRDFQMKRILNHGTCVPHASR